MAKTFTYTAVFTRIELIKMQVRILLRRTAEITDDFLSNIEKGLDKKWINKITIYGLDNDNLCRAQLTLEIDWEEHDFQISKGKATVSIDERWENNTAIEVDEAINIFEKFVRKKGLKTTVIYNHPDWVNLNKVCKELNLVKAETPRWKKEFQQFKIKIPEVPEISVGCYLED